MTPRKTLIIFWAVYAAGAAVLVAGAITKLIALVIAGSAILICDILFRIIFYRCPHCGKFLDRNLPSGYCPRCGKKIE